MSVRCFVAGALMSVLSIAGYSQGPERVSREIPAGVEVVRDLQYASYGDRNLKLDLYRPAERTGAALPAIVVIRGGGWSQGDKEGFGPIAAALAKRGFAAACIEYRASGEATYPAAVEDTKAAVRWVRANANKYGMDPDAIGAIGGSAGAHLATYLGVTAKVSELEGDGGNSGYPSSVSAVVGMATGSDFTMRAAGMAEDGPVESFLGVSYADDSGLWTKASPATHVDASSPPLLLMHGENDSVVPTQQSFRLAQAYVEAGVPVELVFIPGAPHAFWNFTQWFDDAMDRSAVFFRRYLQAGQ